MSKTLSYRGTLPIGEQDRIRLKTNTGKTGYKIIKFQIISTAPGGADAEFIGQIFKTDQTGSIGTDVNFTDSDLLAVAYHKSDSSGSAGVTDDVIIFDNEKFNQDIFVNITDKSGATVPCNYYIELQSMALSDLESTMLTLQSLRSISE
tara:strand:+ start:111 stop:557 length:447 start_codon:yes stop_codon:yes gene_type:complete